MKTTPIQMTALAVALAAAFPALAQSTATPTTLTPVIVTANGIPTRDSDATYASEVHDRAAIEASGAASLTDYLAKNTSLNVLPYFGNRNQPALDMRGYGLENGHQNLAIVVDGQRLNNIEMGPSNLGGIPLTAIESIEITKGSGSVLSGDGAMSGVLRIRTRPYSGVSISAFTGSRGAQETNLSAGLSRDLFDLSFSASNTKQASLSNPDPAGYRDGSDNRAERIGLTLKPVSGLKLLLGGSNSRIDTRFVNTLSPDQFNTDPAQSGGANYERQFYKTGQWQAGIEYEVFQGLTARYMHQAERRESEFFKNPNRYESDYGSDDLSLNYRSTSFDLSAGMQRLEGERWARASWSPENRTSKNNKAFYVQGVYRLGALALSAGVRREKVEYMHAPLGGTQLNGEHKLSAWDFGANYRFNERHSVFANLNQGFQAPDIDRFFDISTGVFNGFIEPAKVKTITVGVNDDTPRNRLRAAMFYSKLKNEIYYDPITMPPGAFFAGVNSNIDKSHKYGLELSDRWQAFDTLSLFASYTYTRAIIDNEDSGGGAFNGKTVPGVPRHGVTLGLNWQPWTGGNLNLNHVWRDSSYAFNNLVNTREGMQSIYSSTSLSFRQRWGKIEGFVGIDNLFDRQNGLWTYYGASNVYPVDFRRTARVGIKVDLF